MTLLEELMEAGRRHLAAALERIRERNRPRGGPFSEVIRPDSPEGRMLNAAVLGPPAEDACPVCGRKLASFEDACHHPREAFVRAGVLPRERRPAPVLDFTLLAGRRRRP